MSKPFPLLGLALSVLLLPWASPAQELKPFSAIRDGLQPFVDRELLAGAVTLAADREKVLALDSVGWADREKKVPMAPDKLFWIASQTKPITATALMMLVDEGKISVDDPLSKYLPEFKDMQVGGKDGQKKDLPLRPLERPITIRHLLTHTSGLPFKAPEESPTLDTLTLAERMPLYARLTLQFQPGTDYAYSNSGINILGRLIEMLSGKTYEAFLDERLFAPLGMKDTTFWPDKDQQERLAIPYKASEDKSRLEPVQVGQLRYPLDDKARTPMPAGGLFSTADDVGRFCRMILHGGQWERKRLVSEESVRLMTTRQTPPEMKNAYGLGWSVGGGHTAGHGGAYSTSMNVDFDKGLVLVFLVQNAGWRSDEGKGIQRVFEDAARKAHSTAQP